MFKTQRKRMTFNAMALASGLALTLGVGCGSSSTPKTETTESTSDALTSCATISPSAEVLTVINLLKPAPENQAQVVDLLNQGLEQEISGLDGFISSTVHRSLDNEYVVNYAQWRDADALQNVVTQLQAGNAPKMGEAFGLGNPDYHVHAIVDQQAAAPVQFDCDNTKLTLINFLVPAEGTETSVLAAQLAQGMVQDVMATPGFISSSIHQSQDSNLVINYAQWENQESVGDVVTRLEAGQAPALGAAFSMSTPEFHAYQIVGVHFPK